MPNPFIPRATVHDWSEKIGDDPATHSAALSRLLKDQRRLAKFIEENNASMAPGTAQVSLYLVGVITRMYELAGGRLRNATWEQIRDASARVSEVVPQLLPVDAAFPERVRAIEWRAQPHILDEALMALFQREKKEEEADLADAEKAKVFLMLWVANEVLEANWKPPAGFGGENAYSYVHIDPKAA